jgi:predicted nucleic acid-binding protein
LKAFLDTSVLIAAFYGAHEHDEPSCELFANQDVKHFNRLGPEIARRVKTPATLF